jgi:hypothetical protein
MSIYRRTDRVPLSDVTVAGTTHAPGAPLQSDQDGRKRRAADPANGLLRPTTNWASTLPPAVRPNTLLAKFPRIANLIAALWQDPSSLRRYLDDLLVDKRGDRQGFQPDILRELFALRAYYDELNPQTSRPWEVMNNGE